MLAESQVGATVELARLPCGVTLRAKLNGAERALGLACILAGGDDYELCFTALPAMRERIAGLAQGLQLPLASIGTVTAGSGLVVHDEHGRKLARLPQAFDHFH